MMIREKLIMLTSTALLCITTGVVGQNFEHHLIADSLGIVETLVVSDLDQDGDVDLLFSDYQYVDDAREYRLLWLENDGDGNFSEELITEEAGWIMGVTVVDFDLDGDNDILLAGANEDYSVTILENYGDLEFRSHIVNADFGLYYMPDEVKAADLNDDGMVDFVVSYYYMDAWGDIWGGLAYFIQEEEYAFSGHELVEFRASGWIDLNLFDYDGNGTQDVITNEISCHGLEEDQRFGRWMNDGEGRFTYEPLPLIGWYGKVKWIDFNQDGLLDFVRYRGHRFNSTILQLFERDEEGDYTLHEMHNDLSLTGFDLVIGDFDVDGEWEFILVEIGAYYLECDGDFNIEWQYITGFLDDAGPIPHIRSTDVNNDGLLDCIFAIRGDTQERTGEIYLLENTHGQSVPDGNEYETPSRMNLLNVYPNPFNSIPTVSVSLQKRDIIQLDIHDLTGRMITAIYSGYLNPGKHMFRCNSTNYSAGVYFLKLTTRESSITKKFYIMK